MNELSIRKERAADYEQVHVVVESAFKTMEHSSGTEQDIVRRLRDSPAFIPELSLVAELSGDIIGHIMISKVIISSDGQSPQTTLSLAPVSVAPRYQNQGVGSALIQRGHEKAKDLGYSSIVLIGHESYYPRFGYRRADEVGISFPFPSPLKNCMVVELVPNALDGVYGVVQYPEAFLG